MRLTRPGRNVAFRSAKGRPFAERKATLLRRRTSPHLAEMFRSKNLSPTMLLVCLFSCAPLSWHAYSVPSAFGLEVDLHHVETLPPRTFAVVPDLVCVHSAHLRTAAGRLAANRVCHPRRTGGHR